ncbi:MAG TPA: hypothetical protein DD473_13825 [Planctomycetaceae bacterium]|nr:hypothetical protein [Planctomycetaceae bacterium]|tara:strand:- start:553 stop:972 length:420 start_codon:yes stop_codon:yes gene_type:complete
MSRVTRHFTLPVASAESVTDPKLFQYGKTVTLYFDYFEDGVAKRSGIRFESVAATRTRNERFASSQGMSFDKLKEIHESAWVAQMKQEIGHLYQNELSQFRHFVIYLDSAGSFEVLASDFEILPEESGSWESLRAATAD